jgi:hypothetical protein
MNFKNDKNDEQEAWLLLQGFTNFQIFFHFENAFIIFFIISNELYHIIRHFNIFKKNR